MDPSGESNRRFKSASRPFCAYVTVVFLPMGFVTALFSMNAAPSGRLIGQMVEVALITLLVTGAVLANAGGIFKMVYTLVTSRGKMEIKHVTSEEITGIKKRITEIKRVTSKQIPGIKRGIKKTFLIIMRLTLIFLGWILDHVRRKWENVRPKLDNVRR